ncbi:hypothetical protein GCM10010910_22620 [Microbacterium nanhaiense]|uniref:Uncharacterized protein n=1 Tax=Microbacterium nanhaiense TaxID=1301026 RepID=A0ABQ2N3D4_9MICO|nr:hypothetical protein GCM10010910_22620 [Microbacterium nanhaiense]
MSHLWSLWRRYSRVKWDTGRGVSQLWLLWRCYSRVKWDTGRGVSQLWLLWRCYSLTKWDTGGGCVPLRAGMVGANPYAQGAPDPRMLV